MHTPMKPTSLKFFKIRLQPFLQQTTSDLRPRDITPLQENNRHSGPMPPNGQTKPTKNQEGIDADEEAQAAFTEQFYREQAQHWADSYGDDENPFRGGTIVKSTAPKPKPKPAPINNPSTS
ncbi:hypothetical protein F5Y16DRAFT_397774 [Xylariaceae sp. FL0255]|nr:hypothetical protein F5Y16DRAFT_397774 [Xylariaceae sp. FL0255]